MENIQQKAEKLLDEATMNAWKSLKQRKFSQFGYWAAKVVQFRELLGKSHEPSPFSDLVKMAMSKFPQNIVEKEFLSDIVTTLPDGSRRTIWELMIKTTAKMFCSNCHDEIEEGACSNCGTPFEHGGRVYCRGTEHICKECYTDDQEGS